MDAHQLLKAGRLAQAISALESQIARFPHDVQAQIFLYELICFTGDFDRAEQQLSVVARESGPGSETGIASYRSVLVAERERQRLFLHRTRPPTLVEGSATSFVGTLNGSPFLSFSDADPRIADQLEIFVGGSYYWVALAHTRRLRLPAPRRLRDLLWLPGELDVAPPESTVTTYKDVWLPMMAPLTWQHFDEEVRLGRFAEWQTNQFGDFVPFGLKRYMVDRAEIPLAEIRDLTIKPVMEPSVA